MKDKDSLNENQRGAFCSSLKVQQQLGSFLFWVFFHRHLQFTELIKVCKCQVKSRIIFNSRLLQVAASGLRYLIEKGFWTEVCITG